MDYEIQRSTRHCSVTGRELREGETFYSALISEEAQVRRLDFSAEAWTGPPPEPVLGWWKSQVPTRAAKKLQMAPNDVLLEYFEELKRRPAEQDALYVLALLLVRRRVLRIEESQPAPAGGEELVLYCPRDETLHRIHAVAPSAQRVAQIEQKLGELLFSGVA